MHHEAKLLTPDALPPAESFLHEPEMLRYTLEERQALNFTPYPSGLFPASELTPEMAKATGMGMAWLRDNAHMVNAFLEAGRTDLAVPAGRAMLEVLTRNHAILDGTSPMQRLPVRVDGTTLENDAEPRVQNDATGYALWAVSKLIHNDAIQPDAHNLNTIAKTTRYLQRIEYWHDPDHGHWEEDLAVHATSIGAVMAGLRTPDALFGHLGYRPGIDIRQLEAKGSETLDAMIQKGTTRRCPPEAPKTKETGPPAPYPIAAMRAYFEHFDTRQRPYDAAMLFLVEPLQVIQGDLAEKIVQDIEQRLVRDIGTTRYVGDTYWEPKFPLFLGLGERTTVAEGRMEQRNLTAAGVAYTQTEAQWTLFDSLISTYWGKRCMASSDPEHGAKHLHYLNRALRQFVPREDGTLKLPELFYYESANDQLSWIPNDHVPLLWAQANCLRALHVFEQAAPLLRSYTPSV